MKKIIGLIACATIMLFATSCSANSELEGLKKENSELRAQISKQETTTAETTTAIEPQLTEGEIKSKIRIFDIVLDEVNSAGGVSFSAYYANCSDVPIKYLTLIVQPYNAVGDVVSCDIRGKNILKCQVTGPINKIKTPLRTIAERKQVGENDETSYYFFDKEYNEWGWLSGYNYTSLHIIGSKTITDNDITNVAVKSAWKNAWYNSTIESIKLIGIEIEYMDNTSIEIPSDLIQFVQY